jgi:hypothetical protein
MSRKTIYGYVGKGELVHVRIRSNIRLPIPETLEWIERRTFRPRHSDGNNPSKKKMPGADGLKE